jgi:tRNA(fMet)-specific endonuclease VapC
MVVDTSIVIETFRGDTKLSDLLDEQPAVYLSSIVIGELYVGANRSVNKANHLKKIKAFIGRCIVLPVDEDTANQYGIIKAELLKKGKPIPENDIWIAAVAKQIESPVLTSDQHFKLVSAIKVKYW